MLTSVYVFACERCKAMIANHEPHGHCDTCGVEWVYEGTNKCTEQSLKKTK